MAQEDISGVPAYRNPLLPVEVRVRDLMSRMTLEEKVGQMIQVPLDILLVKSQRGVEDVNPSMLWKVFNEYHVGSILGTFTPMEPKKYAAILNRIQEHVLKTTRLGIPVLYACDAVHGVGDVVGAEVFPHNIGLAATWDPALVEECASITAEVLSALGGRWTFSPVCDLARDIRWGRTYETFGESPHLAAEMAAAAVRGYQKGGTVAATAKHFIGYSQPVHGQDRTVAYIPDRILKEVHLPAFRAAIKAGCLTVMVNSSEVNGIPLHSSEEHLRGLLRRELGFSGVVISDWDDVIKLHTVHRVARSIREAVKLAVNAGIDIAMLSRDFETFHRELVSLVESGEVPLERIDEAVANVLRLKFRLGLFEHPLVEDLEHASRLISEERVRETALRAARESIVLLKNDGVLPLGERARSILVAGPCANNKRVLVGGWTLGWQGPPEGEPSNAVTIFEGIRSHAPPLAEVRLVEWVRLTGGPETGWRWEKEDLDMVVEAAKKADVVVLALGEHPYAEGMGDVDDLELPEPQQELAEAVHSTGVPMVVVLVAGRPRILGWIADAASAILMAWLPGTQGGNAVAEILFGKYNPSGRLPVTWPKKTGQVPIWYNHRPNVRYEPQYPFGYGLSYTTFAYEELRVEPKSVVCGEEFRVSVRVANRGQLRGAEVVQVYFRDLYSTVTTPVRELLAFRRVDLEPGQAETVVFTVPTDRLSLINREGKRVVEPGTFELMAGPLKDYLEVVAPSDYCLVE